MTTAHNRVAVLHGVNFDILDRRDPEIYGGLSLDELETQDPAAGRASSAWRRSSSRPTPRASSSSTCTALPELADAALVNAGAWTHYSRAIADALEVAGLPAVEVHLSDVESREDWRRVSVFDGLVLAKISGKGPDGYREALEAARRASSATGQELMRGRGDRLAAWLAERELDRLLVTDLVNVRYLTGFSGTNGACVCGAETRLFLTDFRYTERAEAEVEGWEVDHRRATTGSAAIAERLAGRVGFEDDHIVGPDAGAARGEARRGGRAGRRPAATVEELRRVKDEGELAAIAAAAGARRRGLALEPRARPRRAHRARGRPRRRSADPRARRRARPSRRSSPPARTAPCRTPSRASARSARGELVVFDMGAKLDGYCSDGTRTFATGEPGERGARGLRGRARGPGGGARGGRRRGRRRGGRRGRPRGDRRRPATASASATASATASASRSTRRRALSQRSEDVLAAGEVVTVEPGVYLPGELGVRIEDLVVVTEDGYRNLSGLPKELQIVD